MPYRHPTARLLVWLMSSATLVIASAATSGLQFFIIGCVALALIPLPVMRLIWRTRYLLIATTLSFLLLTPGEIIPALPWASYEGAHEAVVHGGRLLLMVILVAFLRALLTTQQLMLAVIGLLRLAGRDGETRTAAPWLRRLMLTLDAMTQSPQNSHTISTDKPYATMTSADDVRTLYLPRWQRSDVQLVTASALVCGVWLMACQAIK
jgi:hypothetical protein